MTNQQTSRRTITLYWILLIVPAVIVSGFAATLLLHEQERINRAALDTMTRQARSIARTIHATVAEVEQRLSRALLEIDSRKLTQTLLSWEETNPLVRNVFVWDPVHLLQYPVRGLASTSEERQFINRFAAIFSNQIPFDDRAVTGLDGFQAEEHNPVMGKKSPAGSSAGFSRQSLYDLAGAHSDKKLVLQANEKALSGGWIPWFSQNRLHILGWVQQKEAGPVYGLELELVCLLSRLITDFPVIDEKGTAWALLDSRRQVIHRSGAAQSWDVQASDIRVPLTDLLPHWEIAVYLDKELFLPARGFIIVSGLLLCIFMVAIVSGGVLLTRQANQRMKAAMQKTSFVSSVSHELKTPLTSIRMYAELMLAGRVKDPVKQNRYLEVMVAESQRLTRLINNVLDFGKLEQGVKTYHKVSVDIEQMVRQIVNAHSIRIRGAGFEIATRIVPGDYMARTDPDALEQVVLNLVDNALKYASQGRFISFELGHDNAGPAEMIVLKICDKGPGIPEAHQAAVFKQFYRIDHSLTATRPGSGLGLSIARQILTGLGGDLNYESRPVGGCFVARIKK